MRGSFIGFRGCEGPQPSKVRNGDRSSDRDLEGVRSLGAVLVDASFVLPQQAIRTMRGSLLGFATARDRSPPKSRTAIEVLIQTWRASGPSAPYWSMPASFCRNKPCVQCGALYWVSRLRGTAALQSQERRSKF